MNFTETYEKIKSNIMVQNALKKELEERLHELNACEADIKEANEELETAFADKDQIKEFYIEQLSVGAQDLYKNLRSKYLYKQSGGKYYGLCFNFLGKEMDLLDNQTKLLDDNRLFENVDILLDRYLTVGDAMFNQASIDELKKIKALYESNPAVVENKMINIILSREADENKLNKKDLSADLTSKETELDLVDAQLEGKIDFKNDLLNKLFNRNKLKLEARRAELIEEIEIAKQKLATVNTRLADKEGNKAEATARVQSNLAAVEGTLNWINVFEKANEKLATFTTEYIVSTENKIKSYENEKIAVKSRINEIQALIKMNKKTSNDIMANAFADKQFVKDMKATLVDGNEEDVKTIKFINGKYDEYIRGQVQALVD